MVQATPAAAFIVTKADPLLEFEIVPGRIEPPPTTNHSRVVPDENCCSAWMFCDSVGLWTGTRLEADSGSTFDAD
jgi:hypothetical protein